MELNEYSPCLADMVTGVRPVVASGVPKVLAQNVEGLWWKETTAEHEAALAAIVPRAVAELPQL